jgi:hypothetical protein
MNQSNVEGTLLCFDRKGRILWNSSARREMTFGQDRLSPLFYLSSVEIVHGGIEGRTKVVIICSHPIRFPTYVVVLSADGKPLGEFWNSGRLGDHTFLDIDGDGKIEMVLVGTNNEFTQGCLVVLDLDGVRGASPQSGSFRAAGLPPGSEKYYLLFPRTVGDRLESQREIFTNVDVLAQRLIMAVSEYTTLSFQLNSEPKLEDVTISDTCRQKYARYQSLGKIPPGRLDEIGLRNELMKGVKCFDGAGWTTTPTPNRIWIESSKE